MVNITNDWELIVAVCSPSREAKIPANVRSEAYRAAWKHTDAYGPLGYMPDQGYDWSGFRDSTEESTKNSAEAIRNVLAKYNITEFYSEKLI